MFTDKTILARVKSGIHGNCCHSNVMSSVITRVMVTLKQYTWSLLYHLVMLFGFKIFDQFCSNIHITSFYNPIISTASCIPLLQSNRPLSSHVSRSNCIIYNFSRSYYRHIATASEKKHLNNVNMNFSSFDVKECIMRTMDTEGFTLSLAHFIMIVYLEYSKMSVNRPSIASIFLEL